jgi:hypothetical protein
MKPSLVTAEIAETTEIKKGLILCVLGGLCGEILPSRNAHS